MRVFMYTQDGCVFCDRAKALLKEKGISYDEYVIGKDLTGQEFKAMFPDLKTVPQIFIEGKRIGGYTELVPYLDQHD